jgi:hypothetical protein
MSRKAWLNTDRADMEIFMICLGALAGYNLQPFETLLETTAWLSAQ